VWVVRTEAGRDFDFDLEGCLSLDLVERRDLLPLARGAVGGGAKCRFSGWPSAETGKAALASWGVRRVAVRWRWRRRVSMAATKVSSA